MKKFRPISELERTTSTPHISSLIEISEYQAQSNKYVSVAQQYGHFQQNLNEFISASMTEQYNLSANSSGITISNVTSKVKELSCANTSIYGKKTFTNTPSISTKQANLAGNDIPTVDYVVNSLLEDNNSFIKPDSEMPDDVLDRDGFANQDLEDSIRLQFGSTPASLRTSISAEVPETGYLVMWGWLADSGDVDAEKAWVRLEGYINNKWVPISVQPWVIGSYSRVLQYVGFNLPVHKGLKIRAATGFSVNINNSAFQNTGSMTFKTNQPATFYGYVIRSK